ncbi:NfeD family protein [Consotaella salsifontis]|uniref:NfeD-like C-terminal domain-containing protein n=1 Tax=Consotaella salsifontis TaxID=1365950 RepID=A0A1T4R8R2_9HYPH|nr:NfeD family protein [Consotaella salsifontis]SKA12315.1 hypothetical protein SAMN05428963_106117 [Consotaella salsifontis]
MSELWPGLLDYGWWIVGLVLLAVEIAAPGVYLIFFGIAALLVGTNVLIWGGTGWFGFSQQVLAFIVLSAVCILLGRRWYGAREENRLSPHLNHRTARLVGRQAKLSEAITNGRGRIAIEDSWWSVEGPDMPAGSRVMIVGADGAVLKVEPAQITE